MVVEKQGSKSGGYVGGFLQLFDWNAKSRKKLFSSKSDIPELSKQKKRCDGNLPMTRVHLNNEDDTTAVSSVKGSSDYSCASSVTDEEYYGIKPAGVVARLMGLDCLPSSNLSEPYSTPFFDSQSLRSAPSLSRNLEYQQNFQTVYSSNLQEKMEDLGRSSFEPKQQKIISRPIEKFQTEILPPKSAKSIPATHYKALSPIKRANSIPPQNAAHIMEIAARILDAGPQAISKVKSPLIGSSSVPLKYKGLKERAEASQKVAKIAEASRRPAESNASKYLKGQPMNKSWNGSADIARQKDFSDSDESFGGGKTKGKSVSLALQAKANVQKREGLNAGSSRSVLVQKEPPSKVISNQLFTSQPSTEKNTHKKPSVHNSSSVLRQNNQKQNSMADRGKSPSKQFLSNSQGKRTLSGDSSFVRQRSSGKMAENSKVSSRRLSREADNKKEEAYSCTKSVSRKKRPSDGDIQYEKNQATGSMSTHKSGKLIQSGTFMDREISWGENSKGKGTDIISFSFSTPLTRSMPTAELPREVLGKSHEFSTDFRSNKMQLTSDCMNNLKAPLGHNLSGGDALSTLLDQKLRELSSVVESSRQKTSNSSSSIFQDLSPSLNGLSKTTMLHVNRNHDDMEVDDLVSPCNPGFSSTGPLGITGQHNHQGIEEELSEYGSSEYECRKVFGSRFLSPISVLEQSFLTESCNSSDTAESNNTGACKQSSSVQAKEVFGICSWNKFHSMEPEVDLLDSASSTFGKEEDGKSPNWELEYVKDILYNIESMFMDFAMGRCQKIINPHFFDQLERINSHRDDELKQRRKVVFDCVGECLDLRCRQFVEGGYDSWSKGLLVVKNKKRLAEEVYREISGWSGMGNCMVDELVDKDMSSGFGRWMNFEVEAFELGIQIEKRLLNSLIDEVVADILLL
ncbi:hypothetical protein KY290_001380 [Solanum tuberosum]|uniref:DUF4378 domain-containing protein n=2 Tax=Solanum tuberosum TaxID=4113 RepID=A0ABQ7WLZ4_SOLTU|nr:PREDICTED: uncharacterized protein LOC102606116 [Solanum tuberosum]KAH0781782.1 hypothetical protein KY290_001380 [Solanum tuberosum]